MNNVRNLREQLHLTQAAFAEHCGVSIVSISRYEVGENVSTRNAERIAKACGVSIDFVLGETDDPGREEERFSEEEIELIEEYRGLAPRGKMRVRNNICEMGVVYPAAASHPEGR